MWEILGPVPSSYLWAGGFAAAALVYQFSPYLTSLVSKPFVKQEVRDSKAALDLALQLKDYFTEGSPGRQAMGPVFDAIFSEIKQ